MAFQSIHYQRVSSEEDIVDEDLPPTVVSTRVSDERGLFFIVLVLGSANAPISGLRATYLNEIF